MSVIKLRNMTQTNFLFSEIGPIDDRGIVRGKKLGCTPGSNILVTNEDEIRRCGLLQQLIAEKKLVPLQQQSAPVAFAPQPQAPVTNETEYEHMNRLAQQEPLSAEDVGISEQDSVNLIAGTEEDARELQAYLNSQDRVEAAKAREVVTQQPFSRPDQDLRAEAEPSEPDPKGANGTDLFYEKPARDILVDDPRPPSNLYTDYSEKKN